MVDSPPIKTLELDKICRVCLTVKKDMRPLFGEMIAELLMECARIQVDETDGWPDKICIQCVHQVSRCHAFKSRVEKSDQQLRQYIKGITVIVEEPITQIELPQQIHRSDIQMNRNDNTHHHVQVQSQSQQQQHHQRQEIQITRQDIVPAPQMIITNGQLHNAQIINAGQIVSTSQGQQMIQASTQNVQAGQNVQLCQLVQTGNGTVQMIQQNGQPAQVLQIQRTSDDRCEIIVQQPDVHGETQYYTEDDLKNLVTVTTQLHQEEVESSDDVQMIEQIDQIEQIEQIEHIEHIEQIEQIETEIEEEETEEETVFTLDLTDDSECEDKEYLAEFISMQTSCPYPGRFICNLCRKEFKHVRWLNTHMKSHSNWIKANCKKQPQCNICGRSFKGPGMLKMHMKTHEKPPEQIPTCKVCNKEFKSKTILYRHRQTHLEKNIRCGVCQKSFTTISQLQSHQQKLNHDKIYICSHCNKQFTNTNEFKIHLQQHNNKTKKNDLSND